MVTLATVVSKLNEFAAVSLAEKWDNVGLLIEPSDKNMEIKKIFLTNDLTEVVMKEALEEHANLIISYHPPIFAPLKRLTQASWKERIVIHCIEVKLNYNVLLINLKLLIFQNKIALYSPHTSWDCVVGGVNDWLFESLQIPCSTSAPINVPNPDEPNYGAGRIYTIREKGVVLRQFVDNLKANCGLRHVQVALAEGKTQNDHEIRRLALCAGSGGSLLKNLDIDLFITGELSHHEVLDAVHRGTSVILTNHSNSERGFLKQFKDIFQTKLPDSVEVIVSKSDADPLNVF